MVRDEFLEVAGIATELVGHDLVGERWDSPSALTDYDVGGLAGHLARGIFTVKNYTARPGGVGGLSAAEYVVNAMGDHDPLDSPLHREVRERAEAEAAGGHRELYQRMTDSTARLERELNAMAGDRTVSVLGGMSMLLDDYLVTRLVELIVHLDDLAVSLELPLPELPSGAMKRVALVLAEIAVDRNGSLAVIRAFARRERVESWPYGL